MKKILMQGICLLAVILISGCSTQEKKLSFKIDKTDYAEKIKHRKVLDIHFDDVIIKNEKMDVLIWEFNRDVFTDTGYIVSSKRAFSYDNDSSRRHNFRVSYHAHNVSLRDVLNAICNQSGWSYTETSLGINFLEPIYN